ncbi:hypothetical protein BSKO_11529 [Bryopsis sp. KO-2023]|nr:hypothetical protein BSKO_11529 [Bryopsis sp. KO-2023]
MGGGNKKKGTPANKRRIRNKQRQQMIRGAHTRDLKDEACNAIMECNSCGERQRNRMFCYFCQSVQKVVMCAECGRTKCMGSDCCVPHPNKNATGTSLIGAICDFCEAPICHSRKCLTTHACRCPLRDADCEVCEREVWDHGGRMFRCATCDCSICEDDQFEHQASCQILEAETNHCVSCNRLGTWSCLRCKICFCDTHVKSKVGGTLKKGEVYKCKKCAYELQESKMLSMSTRKHEFGRMTRDEAESGYYGADRGMPSGPSYDSYMDQGMSNLYIGGGGGQGQYEDYDGEENSDSEESADED